MASENAELGGSKQLKGGTRDLKHPVAAEGAKEQERRGASVKIALDAEDGAEKGARRRRGVKRRADSSALDQNQ